MTKFQLDRRGSSVTFKAAENEANPDDTDNNLGELCACRTHV